MKHFYNCGCIILKHNNPNNQQTKTKMNSKITKQDVAVGRIFRCSICDAKCDNTWTTKEQRMVCGRLIDKDETKAYKKQCSQNCHYKHMRDESREKLEHYKQVDERNLPRLIEGLKIAIKERFECTSIFFKMVKHNKMRVKLLTRYLTRQMTLAEIQAEFYTLSRLGMDIAEDWMELEPDETKTYMDWVNKSGWASKFVNGDNQAKAWSVDYC